MRSICAAFGIALSFSLAAGTSVAPPVARPATSPTDVFQAAHPGSPLYYTGAGLTSVYGAAFSHGAGPVESAVAFVNAHAPMFGVSAADLTPGTLAGDGRDVRELMPDLEDGHLRFTLVSYLQSHDGIPVYNADLRLLVRNEEGFPLVLARSGLRPLGDFVVDGAVAAQPNVGAALARARERLALPAVFTVPRVMIWAGTDTAPAPAPALALVFEATCGGPGDDGYEKWLLVADASSGAILHSESLINHIDVTGSVKGMATTGKKADICAAEVLTAMPYARVSIGATVAYADVNGNFTIPNGGASPVTVFSGTRGKHFQVWNTLANPDADPEVLSQSVTPPAPANFVHNQPNSNATHRSGVNAYIHANVVRDYTLLYCPTFPSIDTQTDWPVNINVSGTCNAFYDGNSINFYAAGGGCPSTAFADVVHHEYGHHLVNRAGSGQGQYGEGQSDVMGVLITDEPILAYGFQNNCNIGIRNANNNYQYPQNGEIHDAGQLISGCVWSTRNALIGPYPSTYKAILGSLAVNSILLHTGTQITPQITIDYLTLDDDNADIGDGTPHRPQINAGFAAHNMPAPALTLLKFDFPDGKPTFISPEGGQEFRVQVSALAGTPQQNTGLLYVDPENDGSFVSIAMPQISPNLYGAVFPPITCGNVVGWYVSARTTTNALVTSPSDAPVRRNFTLSADSATVEFTDDFQNDQGWTETGSPIVSRHWDRGTPSGPANPSADSDGSGRCYYLAGTGALGGPATITSPTLDATGADFNLAYSRWYSNNSGSNPNTDTMVVEISNDNGASWVNLETVGPGGPDVGGGWNSRSFRVADKVTPTNQVKVRFILSDVGGSSAIGAGVDSFKLQVVNCGDCPADYNGDGFVDGIDSDEFNNDFEAGDPAADFNGDGFVDGIDYDQFNNAFEAGC